MEANEYVKEYGWNYAKERMEYCKGVRLVGMEVELKRLVDSHDIVTRYEGDYGESAQWFFVVDYCKKHQLSPFVHSNYNEAVLVYNKFVEDVRRCQ